MKTARVVLAVSSLLASTTAFAALPRINTDTLEVGEISVGLWHYRFQRDQDSRLISSSPAVVLSGSREADGNSTALEIAGGITDRLMLQAGAAAMSTDDAYRYTSPLAYSIESRVSGLTDLTVSGSYRLPLSERFVLQPGLSLTLPTASDSPGRAKETVNGVTQVQQQSGNPGGDVTAVNVHTDFSLSEGKWSLQGRAAIAANDDDSSRFRKSLHVGIECWPSRVYSLGVNVETGHYDSSNNDGAIFDSSGSYWETAVFSSVRPGDGAVGLDASLWYAVSEATSTYFVSSGRRLERDAGNSMGMTLGIRFLIR